MSAFKNYLDRLRSLRRPIPAAPPHPFDLAHGVETSGMIPASRLARASHSTAYFAIAPSLFGAVLDHWLAGPLPAPAASYTFMDIGAGKGRALLLASQRRFREVVGIELDPRLVRIARKNLKRWRSGSHAASKARIVRGDATRIRFPRGYCVLYLFHPFDDVSFERLVAWIAASFARRPGELDLLYVNDECHAQLARHPGFVRLWQQTVPISAEDAAYDRSILSSETDTACWVIGNETCSAWRWMGTL